MRQKDKHADIQVEARSDIHQTGMLTDIQAEDRSDRKSVMLTYKTSNMRLDQTERQACRQAY